MNNGNFIYSCRITLVGRKNCLNKLLTLVSMWRSMICTVSRQYRVQDRHRQLATSEGAQSRWSVAQGNS